MLKKIIILIAASLVFALLWFSGLEKVYAHVLAFTTNTIVGSGSGNTNIKVMENDGELVFQVSTLVDGRRGSYPQRAQTLLLPAVLVLAWQVLLFFGLPLKRALKTAGINLGIFLGFHVVFMLLLTAYYNSEVAKFFFHLMMETFYIVALVIIIKDSIRYPQIWNSKTPRHAYD
jgi:Mn2+/Fe2+ NRAMP family transporter